MDKSTKALRILLLEDVPSDAELVELVLQDAGLDYIAERVDTESGFINAMAAFSPHIVLADYRLPTYSGRAALEYAHLNYPDIPVIMVTGALGDEAAVELLKLGASDYVLKDRLVRLSLAIKRALSEAKDIRNRLFAEEKYRTLFTEAHDGILLIDSETELVIDCNPAFERMSGRTVDALKAMKIWELSSQDNVEALRKCFQRVKERGSDSNRELEIQKPDGVIIPMDISAQFIRLHDHNLIQAIIRDITEIKAGEQNRIRLARALRLLSRCNMVLVHAMEEQTLLTEICKLTVEVGGYLMAWVGFVEQDNTQTVRLIASFGYEEGFLDKVKITWDESGHGQESTGKAIRSGVTVVNQDWLSNPNLSLWSQEAINRNFRSSIALPLLSKHHLLGVLTIYSSESNAFVDEEVALLEELAGDLAFGIETLRTRAEHEQHSVILRQSLEQSIQTIAATVEARDPYTAGHQHRVATLVTAMAKEMGLPEEQINGLHLAAIIHDLGKIHIPAEILAKPGKLTEIEYLFIKTHPQAGYEILKDVTYPWPIADIILQHHEKLDGSGYPRGLMDSEILLESKILTVADVVEAMSSHRPYRSGLGIDAALEEIERNRGVKYCPYAVDACLKLFREQGYKLPG